MSSGARAKIDTEAVARCRNELKKSQERLNKARAKMASKITEGTSGWKDETFADFAKLQADINGNIVAAEAAIEDMCTKLDGLIKKAEGINF